MDYGLCWWWQLESDEQVEEIICYFYSRNGRLVRMASSLVRQHPALPSLFSLRSLSWNGSVTAHLAASRRRTLDLSKALSTYIVPNEYLLPPAPQQLPPLPSDLRSFNPNPDEGMQQNQYFQP
ncbi:hypothetical protein ACJRO7_004523 [Eucalyptus globulus]|uniref:Uncharacterized protein n=1 Tax=Eucalyptus globulus TaxID=34317 RepID=A0ABD3IXH0_EUCGL